MRLWTLLACGLGALAILAHPLMAELLARRPLHLLGCAAALFGAWHLIFGRDQRLEKAAAGLGAGIVLAPATTWVFAFLPLAFPELGRGRCSLVAVLLAVGIIAGVSDPAIVEGLGQVSDYGHLTGAEGLASVAVTLRCAVAPWTTPVLGVSHRTDPLLGMIILGAALAAVAGLVARGISRTWQRVVLLLAVAIQAPFWPAFLGDPFPGPGVLLAWAVVLLLARAVVHPSTGERIGMARGIPFAVGLVGFIAAAVPRSAVLHREWNDASAVWRASLAEAPRSRLRWDFAAWLLERGETNQGRRHAEKYLRAHPWDRKRRTDYAVLLVASGLESRALDQLRKGVDVPADDATRATLLDLYQRHREWDLFFPLAEERVKEEPSLHERVARAALEAEQQDTFERHLSAALRAERPSLPTLRLAYRHRLRKQDREGLAELGDRAIRLYPDQPVGYVMRGKAAKIVRDDDEMIRWHGEALARDPSLVEVHFDLGLVMHGRHRQTAQAASHYRAVLEHFPDHPRKELIESWIQSLDAKAN